MAEVWDTQAFDAFTALQLVDEDDLNGLNNSLRFLEEVGYAEFTSNVSVTGGSEGAATAVVSLGAITYEAVPHLLEFFAISGRPDNGAAGRAMTIVLYDSTTAVGQIGFLQTPAAANMHFPIHCAYRFTPSAASHTYNIKAWVSTGSGLIQAGAGGSGTNVPGFMRITRVPT